MRKWIMFLVISIVGVQIFLLVFNYRYPFVSSALHYANKVIGKYDLIFDSDEILKGKDYFTLISSINITCSIFIILF